MNGIEELVERRGDETVPFRQVADHARDYALAHPQDAPVVERLCAFIARIEMVDHEHDVPEIGSTPS